MRKVLLDTNAYSKLLSGDKNVLTALAKADIVYMSIFVLGELYAGFKGGNKEPININLLNKFLQKPTVETINATGETAMVFGQVKSILKKAGTPLPINDVWIAAHTFETGSVLITYDTHFQQIPDLRIWEHL
jgi:tRNA(fMet)-specific endonuclease VapC